MSGVYSYEPPRLEIMLTEFIGNSLMRKYYSDFVYGLGIESKDKVLDYCSGSGIISKKIAKCLGEGRLVFADVSATWLKHAAGKLKSYNSVQQSQICDFNSAIHGGQYDKIVLHYALHDFPAEYRVSVIKQLVKNLKSGGRLFIREPIGEKHGMKLYELINLLESTKVLFYEYSVIKKRIIGEFVDISCRLK